MTDMSIFKFGEILIMNYNIEPNIIVEALNKQENDEEYNGLMIGQILLKDKHIDEDILIKVLKQQGIKYKPLIKENNDFTNLTPNKEENSGGFLDDIDLNSSQNISSKKDTSFLDDMVIISNKPNLSDDNDGFLDDIELEPNKGEQELEINHDSIISNKEDIVDKNNDIEVNTEKSLYKSNEILTKSLPTNLREKKINNIEAIINVVELDDNISIDNNDNNIIDTENTKEEKKIKENNIKSSIEEIKKENLISNINDEENNDVKQNITENKNNQESLNELNNQKFEMIDNSLLSKEEMQSESLMVNEIIENENTLEENINTLNLNQDDEDIIKYKGLKIGEILVERFGVMRSIIDEGLFKQNRVFKNKKKIGEILIEDGLVSRDILYHAYSIQKGMSYLNYNKIKQRVDFQLYKDPKLWKAFNPTTYINLLYTIMRSKAIPMYWDKDIETGKDYLVMGITDFDSNDRYILIDMLKKYLSRENIDIKEYMTSEKLYSDFELKYKELTIQELEFFSKKIDEITPEAFLQYLLTYAILHGVSDIHISPAANDSARIAVRILGEVETLFYINLKNYNALVNVIKNNADMKVEKMFVPQDGRIDGKKLLKDFEINVNRVKNDKNDYGIDENKLKYNFESVSFRVSTYPTEPPYELPVGQTFEKVVIRVLNLSNGLVELGELGLNKAVTDELTYAKSRNQGIIFIVGPTGSGKSTTIYSALSSINAIRKNIISFEDPVEMRQLYWSQGQRKIVPDNVDMNFDYLESKKSILRQDPDIILMGEVRDEDSANFAIEAANTGHLVFTTLHSNSAAAAFERIKKLGVMPLEIASATICVMSQRLVKEVCQHCKIERDINEEEMHTLKRLEYDISKAPKLVIQANLNGCKYCNYKGYVGRTTLAEIIPINSKVKEAIVDEKPDYYIRNIASETGHKTMLEDGIDKMNEGKVSLEDVLKLI